MSKHHKAISVTEIWYQTWKIFSGHFLKFLFVAAVPIMISYIFLWSTIGSFVFSLKTLPDPKELFSASSGFVYFSLIAFIIIIISQIWGTIALLVTTINHKDIKISQIFYKSLEYFWSFILLGLASGLVTVIGLIAGYLIVTILSIILGLFGIEILNQYFLFLNLIPTLITLLISLFLLFSPYFLIEAKVNVLVAMRKSYRLVKAFFWPIFIRLILIYVVLATLIFLLKFIPYIGQALSILLAAPILSIYIYSLYIDLKPKT